MEINTELYQRQFYQEAKEILEEIISNLLKVESDPDNRELLNALFRGIHTIKGSAGVLEMDDISGFAHHIETVLNLLRNGKISLIPDVVDTILAGVDHIIKMIDDRVSGKETITDQALVDRFVSYCKTNSPETAGYAPLTRPTLINSPETAGYAPLTRPTIQDWEELPTDIQNEFQNAKSQGLNIFQVDLQYTSEHLENGYDPLVFLRNLKKSSLFYYVLKTDTPPVPCIDKIDPLKLYLYPKLFVTTKLSAQDIYDLTFDPSLVRVEEIRIPFDGKRDAEDEEAFDPALLQEFIESVTEILESLEKGVILYEKSGSRDSLNEIFRAVHNIKGDADFIGLKNLAIFAHALESLLENLRSGSISQSPALTDIILQSVDFLRQSITKLAQDGRMPDLPQIYETLKSYVIAEEAGDWEKYLPSDSSPEIKEVFVDQVRQYKKILVEFAGTVPLKEKDHKIVERALNGLLKISEFAGISPLSDYTKSVIDALHHQDNKSLSDSIFKLITFMEGIDKEPKKRLAVKISAENIPQQEIKTSEVFETSEVLKIPPAPCNLQPAPQESRTMRIDERKVEDFTNMAGELLVARNTYEHLLNQISGIDGISRKIMRQFKDNLYLFSRLTNDIHHGVISLRMVPVGRIFQKFNRVIRDISRKQKKLFELVIGGEDIEIDKKIADMLSDPLVHLIRNACDHGIETPDERRSADKPEKGTILLRASQEGSNLSIEIIDDGRGIDREKIYEKARQSGLEVDKIDSRAVLDLIFIPGLTTSAEVSDISGRGVGLDVVKTAVHSLGGLVKVASEKNKGTEITLSIPMTMGIGTVLLVESQNKSYAVPLSYIVATLKISPDKIKRAGNKMFFYYRGDVLPVERLEKILNADSKAVSNQRFETTMLVQVSDLNQPTSNESSRSKKFGKSLSDCSVRIGKSEPEPPDLAIRRERFRSAESGDWREKDKEISVIILKTIKGQHGIIVDRFDKNMELAIKPLPAMLAGLNIASGVSIMGDGRVLLVLNPDNLNL